MPSKKILNISLKTKTAVGASLLFVAFSVAITYFSVTYMERSFKQSLADRQYALACAIAQDIDDKLLLLQKALQAASLECPAGIAADPDKAQRFLDRQGTLHSLFDTRLFLLGKEGRIVAETPFFEGRRGVDLSYRQYFQQTVATGKSLVSSPYISSLPHHQPVVMLTAPVFDSSGNLTCILCCGLMPLGKNLLGDLQQVKIGSTGYIYLTTADKTLILHPDKSRIMTAPLPPGVNLFLDKAAAGFDGSGETVTSIGVPVLASSKHLNAADWILMLNSPLSEAYAPIYTCRNYVLAGIAAGTVAMLAIVWLVMKRLMAPLVSVTGQVEAMGRGKEALRRIDHNSSDEIGTLVKAFNGMVAMLEEKQAVLQERENNFAALAETASDGMLVINGDGSFAYANYHAARLLGYSVKDLLRCSISDVVPPDDLPHVLQRLHKIVKWEKVPKEHEIRMLRDDGRLIPVEVSSSLTIWQEKSADLMIFRDISDRRRIEKALLDSYNLLQQTFASLNEAVFIVRTDTREITDCNVTAERMFGYTRQELTGVTASCLHLSEERFETFGRGMLRGYREKGYFETVFQMKRKDGTIFDSEHFVSPIRDAEGVIVSHVCVVRDMSDRKRDELEIRKLNEELQLRIEELATANRDMETFSYSLTHDLRAPLTTIYCAAQGLRDLYAEQLDENGNFFVEGICKASERMEEIINATHLLARVSRSELQHEEIDMSDLVTRILTRLRLEDQKREATTTVTPGVKATADLPLMKSALENLLGNAWKYTRRASEAHIEFGVVRQGNEQIYFVKDNGAGFDMKLSDKLFKPFQRLHSTREYEGSGIGLATVERIILRHGGKLWGEGAPGKGATFYFTLPDLVRESSLPQICRHPHDI